MSADLNSRQDEHTLCPSCGARNPYVDEWARGPVFCLQCRFPLTLIANKYQLLRKLGEGGFGVVYQARHVNLMRDEGRVVKVMRAECQQDKTLTRRFMREVQVTSTLSQKNHHVVRIYDDFGHLPGLGFYYVMEHLRGMPMDTLLERSADLLPLKLCYHIFDQLCTAMHAAHQDGIVHRDLKPSNLFLVPFLEDPHFLKVIDFGIAKVFENAAGASSHLTNGVLGTPAYMSPEQCMNESIGPATDVYAMGCILFEMLTGYIPFASPSHPTRSAAELITARLMQDAPPMRDVLPEGRIVPQALVDVVSRMLEKHPEDRFVSVKEVQEAFRQAIDVDRDTVSLRPFVLEEDTEQVNKVLRETVGLHPAGVLPTAKSLVAPQQVRAAFDSSANQRDARGELATPAELIKGSREYVEAETIGVPLGEYPVSSHHSSDFARSLEGSATSASIPVFDSHVLSSARDVDATELELRAVPAPEEPVSRESRKGLVLFGLAGLLIFLAVGVVVKWLRKPKAGAPLVRRGALVSHRSVPRNQPAPPKTPVQPRARRVVTKRAIVPRKRLTVPRRRQATRKRPVRRRIRPRRWRPKRNPVRKRPVFAVKQCPYAFAGQMVYISFVGASLRNIDASLHRAGERDRIWRRGRGLCVGIASSSTKLYLKGARNKAYIPCSFALWNRKSPLRVYLKEEGALELGGLTYCLKPSAS